jgi:hypothetical protein
VTSAIYAYGVTGQPYGTTIGVIRVAQRKPGHTCDIGVVTGVTRPEPGYICLYFSDVTLRVKTCFSSQQFLLRAEQAKVT